jgi:hypothetical protein
MTGIHRVAGNIGRKGRLVERIVSWLHERPFGVRVVTREFLPTLDGKEEREIDVLVTDENGTSDIRAALECKNEGRPASGRDMKIFVEKLAAVGIPSDKGSFVSAKGFTTSALELAAAAGITPLVVDNLTTDRLSSVMGEAVQCVVHILPVVTSINLLDEPSTCSLDAGLLHDPGGRTIAVLDLIWYAWCRGQLAPVIGQHFVQLHVPEDWYVLAGGERHAIRYLGAVIHVGGYVIDVVGPAKAHALTHATEGTMENWGLEASWEVPSGRHLLATIPTEQALIRYLGTSRPTVINRVKVPRIRWGSIYWPPSARLAEVLNHRVETTEASRNPHEMPPIQDFDADNIVTAWEPVDDHYFGEPVGWFTMSLDDMVYDAPEAEETTDDRTG